MSTWMILASGAALLGILFLFTWRLSIAKDNYSFVDVTWSLSFAPVAILYGALGHGWMPRRLLIATLVSLWSLRLGIYLWKRVAKHYPKEDIRYAVLREKWQTKLHRAFLFFFLVQAALVWILMLPVFLISSSEHPGFHVLEICGLALWCLGLLGEGIADAQLKRYKANTIGDQGVCQDGLWRFSRHPNYFFQSLLWWALFLMALPAPWGWTAILAPLLMLHFLLRVTGIPLTEKLAVERKGKPYLDYQKTTSAFVPWFPKNPSQKTT
jgi:steroid 5-alpha reductase family enzyme